MPGNNSHCQRITEINSQAFKKNDYSKKKGGMT